MLVKICDVCKERIYNDNNLVRIDSIITTNKIKKRYYSNDVCISCASNLTLKQILERLNYA